MNPKTIVELGYGTGALTVSMAYGTADDARIYSFDLIPATTAVTRLVDRDLLYKCNFNQGNVFTTFLQRPFAFDLLLIDIDNTWPLIYDIVCNNQFINQQISKGAKVIFEGGSENHPRINQNTLNDFHAKLKRPIFQFEHMSGSRTSLSKLTIL
jgi:tRNA A58 N-methylase Trm61